ncbi:MAG: type II toxin-antitoxin system VapC family toxin [Bosea sp.]|uniref:type II toxin-antitoxin system VapC family toxin n=1 Tax=Bosea sp. (in: a-proteobacteria) TaxID=1871050 RepID=UPI00238A2B77|nr:type II toxin-antitoxin system VapC family toxin [Bosea sp. (in: a-proteobacteria)]MCP4734329.1 type II toxin-antitoxin system VapC family toxin [Bosea sp. (in: a-proteobacteria)]
MFVDACAIIAVLSDEPEAERVSRALVGAKKRITSPVAVLEAVLGLARPDKFNLSVEAVEPLVLEFLDERGIDIRDLPPAKRATTLSLSAAHRYRSGRRGLNLGDCLHYACAKYYRVPILATAGEFRETDLETVP